MTLDIKFDILIYEMFFYPGIKIAESMNIPCVRQFSQPAWNQQIISSVTRLFKLSGVLIDFQVMGKKNANHMKLKHKTLIEAVVNDKPDLNIVYVPQIFQKDRDSFGNDYLFTVPVNNINSISTEIPYKEMKHPIVYISLGSIISNRGFCKECIRAFGKKDMSVILNTGKVKPDSLGKIPSNIYAYSFVPQIEVLQHSDVFLTHCGMNSVNEAMALGVPMVAMPFVNDQISNAERITHIGIGKRVRSFPSSGRELYRTVREVYQDKCIRERSKEVQKLVNNEMGIESIIGRIEGLV